MLKWMFSLLLIVVLSVTNLQAQFKLAVSAGFNSGHSQLYNVDYINTKNKKLHTSFYTGIIPSYQFNTSLGVLSEIQYSEVGTHFKIDNFTQDNDIKYYAEGRYLRLIPQLEIKIFNNFYINGGPNIGIMIDSESNPYTNMSASNDIPKYKDAVSNFDMGATVGMKYFIDHYFINISYYQGFTDISNVVYTNQFAEVIPNTSQRNHYLQFGLGTRLFTTSDL
jgi:hypothetical protein